MKRKDTVNHSSVKKTAKFNKLITSRDVARLAGVSQSSVSRVFNPNSERNVKPEIREKVLKAAKKLGYRPNYIARSMVSKNTGIIGLVVAQPIGPFYNEIITKIVLELQFNGYQCLVFIQESEENIDTIIEKVLQYQVDGLIITSSALSKEIMQLCLGNEIPFILFNRLIKEFNISSVYCDNKEAGRKVAKLFINLGFKRIANITYKKDSAITMERKEGFCSELKENGITNVTEIPSDYSYDSGYKIALEVLSKPDKPEGVFFASDLIAIGFMDAARNKFGMKIPEDISLVGFDDIEMASWKSYNLTTISQPIDKLANNTVDVLLKLIKTGNQKSIIKSIDTELILRGTTPKIKNNF